MSLFETKCPLCKGSLWIDPASMKVVDHKPADQQKADFDRFLKDSKMPKEWDDKIKKAKEEEARRKAEIEQKFRQAKDNGPPGDEGPVQGLRSDLDWD